eukprot:TRINITY_DN37011_c0_g1_i1.p1 TRINITY_DN37011_c0_g1~~TRINITY_DN37011_c0_g1_i1.p1  ORF type:complete len:306 (+),score=77.07 TRINITY_DN37011_c0_g1_i1:72-989(+)
MEVWNTARSNPKVLGCCGCSIFIAILVGISFASLEYTELGLNYSLVSSSVENKAYSAGLYILGPGHSFIRFPSTVQTIQFSTEHDSNGPLLRSRTSDGLEVALEISFQYQLNVTTLPDLYRKFGMDYNYVYVNMAMDLLTASATGFNATAFFNDRQTISMGMESELKDHFLNEAFAEVPFFQLRSVSLPPSFEKAIQETEVQKQDIQTASAEKGNQEVQMQTKVLQAQQQAHAIELAANASAQSVLLDAEAYVAQFKLTQQLQAESFKSLYEKLGNNETLLLDYMRARAMRDHPDHLSVVGMANA